MVGRQRVARPDCRHPAAPGGTRARARATCGGRPHLLPVDRRRLAVRQLHAGADRTEPARRPQPRLLRRAPPAAAEHGRDLAQRPGLVRGLPGVLPRARDRAPVVGTGRRLAQLPRAVAERRVRAVLRRDCTLSITAATRPSPTSCGSSAGGASRNRIRARSISGYRLGHVRNESRVFRALIYNKGAAVLHMLRGLVGDDAFFRGIPALLRGHALSEGRHRGSAVCDGAGVRTHARALLRAVDLRLVAALGHARHTASSRRRRASRRSCCASSRRARSSTCRSP